MEIILTFLSKNKEISPKIKVSYIELLCLCIKADDNDTNIKELNNDYVDTLIKHPDFIQYKKNLPRFGKSHCYHKKNQN